MKLLTLDSGARGNPGAILASGEILNLLRAAGEGSLQAWLPDSNRQILLAGREGLDVVRGIIDKIESANDAYRDELRARSIIVAAGARLLAPIMDPNLVVAAGLAYKSHLKEMSGTPLPKHPTGFLKSPSSIIGTGAGVVVPRNAMHHVDYEGELAVVFGRTCHNVSPEKAFSCIAGYTVANDISARDWVFDVWNAKAPWEARLTWEVNIMGKQFSGFTPMGPVITTVDQVPDPNVLQITTRLNGNVMQQAPVSDMLFGIGETIAHFSKWYTFRPGDVLLTGTPAGVGVGRNPKVFMSAGDIVEVEITNIGILRNHIVSA